MGRGEGGGACGGEGGGARGRGSVTKAARQVVASPSASPSCRHSRCTGTRPQRRSRNVPRVSASVGAGGERGAASACSPTPPPPAPPPPTPRSAKPQSIPSSPPDPALASSSFCSSPRAPSGCCFHHASPRCRTCWARNWRRLPPASPPPLAYVGGAAGEEDGGGGGVAAAAAVARSARRALRSTVSSMAGLKALGPGEGEGANVRSVRHTTWVVLAAGCGNRRWGEPGSRPAGPQAAHRHMHEPVLSNSPTWAGARSA